MNTAISAKPPTIGELEHSKDSSVWVRNVAVPPGNINMSMNDGQGTSIVVIVPITFICVDLTTQATKSAILMAPTFRRMLASGRLKLMRSEEAEEMMQNPEAQREASRLYNRSMQLEEELQSMPEAARRAISESTTTASGLAMSIVNSREMEEDQIMVTLRNNEQGLTQEDWKYIAANSTFSRVKTFAAEKVNK